MKSTALSLGLLLAMAGTTDAADAPAKPGYTDTPLQPNGRWRIHDARRPRPPIVTPGDLSLDRFVGPPSDARVLVGPGGDLSAWQHPGGGAPTWPLSQGVLKTGRGPLETKDSFKDFQLHVEWASPEKVQGSSQGRGNSGVFLAGKFEIQVLDSYGNETYADGQASALYGQFPPLVNASRPPGRWQSYDIIFKAPRFAGDTLTSPAVVTVLHNGVVTHAGTAFLGPTEHASIPPYLSAHAQGPIRLQDHGNPVSYRNIWIRPLRDYDQP